MKQICHGLTMLIVLWKYRQLFRSSRVVGSAQLGCGVGCPLGRCPCVRQQRVLYVTLALVMLDSVFV